MEFVLGSLITLGIVVTGNLVLRKPLREATETKLRYSQTHIYSLMTPLLDYVPATPKEAGPKQSLKYIQSSYIRVVIVDDSAYWIKDNALYTAEVVDGTVSKESSRRVDTMSMDKVELDQTMYIVEKLREGLDEDSSTG